MVKSKAPSAAPPVVSRESKRAPKPKVIFDPSDSGEQHAASRNGAARSQPGNDADSAATSVKKTISKTSKVICLMTSKIDSIFTSQLCGSVFCFN